MEKVRKCQNAGEKREDEEKKGNGRVRKEKKEMIKRWLKEGQGERKSWETVRGWRRKDKGEKEERIKDEVA